MYLFSKVMGSHYILNRDNLLSLLRQLHNEIHHINNFIKKILDVTNDSLNKFLCTFCVHVYISHLAGHLPCADACTASSRTASNEPSKDNGYLK